MNSRQNDVDRYYDDELYLIRPPSMLRSMLRSSLSSSYAMKCFEAAMNSASKLANAEERRQVISSLKRLESFTAGKPFPCEYW
jgi:hypothetical protein